jgi:nitrite reductase/ring-hydroxylating ferredoxin subunit/Fe-S cluster biogenesis protein NfuA
LLQDINSVQALIASFDERERLANSALLKAIDALNREALARLIRRLKANAEAREILKEALEDEVIYSVFRHHELIKPSLNERINIALETVRPMLASHGGNVELVSIEPPSKIVVRFIGACDGCPASELTFTEGVQKAIKEHCPEITEIIKSKGICNASLKAMNFVSPFARGQERTWIYASKLSELPEDGFIAADVAGQSVLLARVGAKVVCYQNACAHLGMPLDTGEFSNGILKCSYHGFEYVLESGECITVPEVQLHTHAVRVTDGNVEVSFS